MFAARIHIAGGIGFSPRNRRAAERFHGVEDLIARLLSQNKAKQRS
jgi:hypothetical protein